jgi:hypothetical protein
MAFADGVTPIRWSDNFGASADGATTNGEDSMQEAVRRNAVTNLDSHCTDIAFKSFLSFSYLSISSKLNNVGINMDSNKNQVAVSSLFFPFLMCLFLLSLIT